MSKRRPIHQNPRMNYRNTDVSKTVETKGTRPTAEPTTVLETLTFMVLHLCKKYTFFDTKIRVALYLAALFLISLIADFLPIPRSYFARSDNVLNLYFVKLAWAWNLLVLIPFASLSGLVICCGNIRSVGKEHLPRLLIATFFWWFWVNLFSIVENNYGKCSGKGAGNMSKYLFKQDCLKDGFFWNGFDISGHSFILTYGSLVLIEETRVINGWETIKDLLRNEEHNRNTRQTQGSTNPLRNLPELELLGLKIFYEKFTTYIRSLFILITVQQILWDFMLLCTMLYYHIMVEKFVGGCAAILTWFFTYGLWFKSHRTLPKYPGDGSFKYNKQVYDQNLLNVPQAPRRTSNNSAPRFMGMPIYGNNTVENTVST